MGAVRNGEQCNPDIGNGGPLLRCLMDFPNHVESCANVFVMIWSGSYIVTLQLIFTLNREHHVCGDSIGPVPLIEGVGV